MRLKKTPPLAPHDGLKFPLTMPPATALQNIDPKLPQVDFDRVRTAMALLTASRGPALTWSGWMMVAEALAIGERHALKAGGGVATSRGGYGTTLSEFLRKTGFQFLNKGVRWALRQCLERRDDIEEWRDAQTPERRSHLNNPIDTYDAFQREWNAGEADARRRVAARAAKAKKQQPNLLEEFVALSENLQAVEEQRDALATVLAAIASKAKLADVTGLPDDLLRKVLPYLNDDVQDALHERLYPNQS